MIMPINTNPKNDSIASMFYDTALQGDSDSLYKLGYWYAGKAKTFAGNALYDRHHEVVRTESESFFDNTKKTCVYVSLSLLKNLNANSIVKTRKLTDKKINKLKDELLTPLSNALIFFAMAYGCHKQDLKSVHIFIKENFLMDEKVLTCFYQALKVLHYLRCVLHLKTGWGCETLTRDESSLNSLTDGLVLSNSQYDLLLNIETLLLKPIYDYVGHLHKTCIEPEKEALRAPFPEKIACEFDMDKLEDLLEALNSFNYPIDDMTVSEHAWERHLLPAVEVNANNNVSANLLI